MYTKFLFEYVQRSKEDTKGESDMIVQSIDPNNCYVLVMTRNELEDLIEVVEWFAKTEAELYFQKKWQALLSNLEDARKQQQGYSGAELEQMDLEDLK